jgi:SAM-dependent methyltransferase
MRRIMMCLATLALATGLWTLGSWQASLSHTADTETLRDLEERLAAATEKIRELMAGRERRTGELLGTVPHECSEFEVQRGQFKTLKDLEHMNQIGWEGGQWTACTHLATYGLNFASYYARFLAFNLAPATVLEFGCGLGTMSDFLARFVPGGSRVTCVEPEIMLAEVFDRRPQHATQLAVDLFTPNGSDCLRGLQRERFELVISLEVAEHVPPQNVDRLAELLSTSTEKWLVFSAARPGQGGTGHLDGSMFGREEWVKTFQRYGLVYSHELTEALRIAAFPERQYDLHFNTIVMMHPKQTSKVPEVIRSLDLHGDPLFYKQRGMDWDREQRPVAADQATSRMDGMWEALWPELHLAKQKIDMWGLCSGGTGPPRPAGGPFADWANYRWASAGVEVEAGCLDTPGWTNGINELKCDDYGIKLGQKLGFCSNGGVVAGKEWALGAKHNHPDRHCCVCGKSIAQAAQQEVAVVQTQAQAPVTAAMVADDRGSVGVGDCGAEEKLFPAVLCEDMPDASKSAALARYALPALDRP